MTVLYFDDEPYISKALAENLKIVFDWEVTLVDDIEDLFNELNNNLFDIIIMDIMAPITNIDNDMVIFTKNDIKEMDGGMNTGIVLAQKIWEKNVSIPILFLSAKSQPNIINQFRKEKKRCEFLRKPELAETVNDKLVELLNSIQN